MRTLGRRERESTNKGMPLGNHTSQFFANVYLNELDQFAKHVLKAPYYLRYVDDFAILSNSYSMLLQYKERINVFLKEHLKLELHPQKSHILSLHSGVSFLGYRIFPHHKLLRKRNARAFERKMGKLRVLYHEKQVSRDQVVDRLQGWLAYAEHADTYTYRKEILRNFNRFFPFKIEKALLSKRARNFYKKVAASKIQGSVQKTLDLARKKMSVTEIATLRKIKEGTVWEHYAELIEYGWLSIWSILPRKTIVTVLPYIRNSSDTLTTIKSRLKVSGISYDSIMCVRAHIRYKEKIKRWSRRYHKNYLG